MDETRKLDGKVAIVTGAGSQGPGWGTGKASSVLFAREGAKVVLVDVEEERAKETLRLIEDEGGEATIVTADLAVAASAQEVVDEAVSRYGTVDVLVTTRRSARRRASSTPRRSSTTRCSPSTSRRRSC